MSSDWLVGIAIIVEGCVVYAVRLVEFFLCQQKTVAIGR